MEEQEIKEQIQLEIKFEKIEEDDLDLISEDETLYCLVANDEDYQLNVIKLVLEKNSFIVVTAKNGYEAFKEV